MSLANTLLPRLSVGCTPGLRLLILPVRLPKWFSPSVLTPRSGELAPKIVYRNEVIPNGSDILTDDFVVKVILSAQVGDAGLVCRHFDFPSESLQLGREEGLRQLKEILNKSVSRPKTEAV